MRFDQRNKRVELAQDPENNIILIEQEEFFLEHMDSAEVRQRGGNSNIFRAVSSEGDESLIVKLCKYPLNSRQAKDGQRVRRFDREIRALTLARESPQANCVIRILDTNTLALPWTSGNGTAQLRYYIMEEADSDLTTYLTENELSFQQQVLLCRELLLILNQLHELGVYHRDIKADNILMLDGRPRFGDLGLIAYRQEDEDIDGFSEKIGPVGLLSPEATNKCLGLRTKRSFAFDCRIDEKSDIFQLGQVFWLILQSEVPTGHLTQVDVKFPHEGMLGTVLHPMLQYGKERRANIATVEAALQPILQEVALL